VQSHSARWQVKHIWCAAAVMRRRFRALVRPARIE
jgi:hypothetical protein